MTELRTERLVLRPMEPDDVDAWYAAIWSDPEVMRFLPPGEPVPRERAVEVQRRFADHWAQHGFGVWAVWERDSGRLVGHCGIRWLPEHPEPEVEVLYGFARDRWGLGYATEAARAAVRFGFQEAGLGRIVALAVPENAASLRVMEKLGMAYDGEVHEFGWDLVQYAVDREEFEASA